MCGALANGRRLTRSYGDNLGDNQVPVRAAELDVIETHLDHVLRDLLASSMGGSEQEQT
jgi:hypothetical protein